MNSNLTDPNGKQMRLNHSSGNDFCIPLNSKNCQVQVEIPDPSPEMAKQPHERSILSEENGGGESPKVDVKCLRCVQLMISVQHKQCHLRLVEFLEKWKIISSDHNILDIIQGCQIVEKNNTPHQIRHPKGTNSQMLKHSLLTLRLTACQKGL